MSVKSLFALASLVAIAAVSAIAYLILPERIWSPTSIGALLLFGFSIGFGIYSPFSLPGEGKGGDAAPMASLGAMGTIVTSLLGWSALTFVVALTGRETVTWAMMVITVAGFVISNLLLHATAKIVDQAAAGTSGPSVRVLWRGQLENMLSATTDENARVPLGKLIEKIQFAASDVPGQEISANDQVTTAIEAAREHSASGSYDADQFQRLIAKVAILLDQREAQLKALRSKA